MSSKLDSRPSEPAGLVMPDPLGGRAPRRSGGVVYVLDALRTRPAGRRVLSALSAVLFVAGAAMFAYPLATDVYATQVLQERLADQYQTREYVERYASGAVADGEPLTRMVMPRLGVDALVVEGTSPTALRAGAGHYPTTPLPGQPGNVAVAGHRTTYGKPFNRLDELAVGDEIRLETPLATHVYQVVAHPQHASQPCPNGACWITNPNDWGVVGPVDGSVLTLTTCHPKGSARQRLILRAQLVQTLARDMTVG
ncbi:MAG TPA: class E sortase [Egibacteraceae bacterium]|nr:class E sortase [Egibacteraceae bacterium]